MNHWMVNNYGALLLAYALEKTIANLGYEVESIQYLPDEVEKPWKLTMVKKVGVITYLLRLGYFLVFILPRQKSFAKMRRLMNTSLKKYNDESIREIEKKYDKIVIGGDQLWNYKINYFNRNNFLPFVKEANRKIVYAASLAQDEMRPGFEQEFKQLVEGFGFITTRERRATEIIEKYTDRKAPRVSDPAFFLTAEEWRKLEDEDKKAPSRFIFVYQVQSDTEVIKFASKLADQENCKIVYCPFPLKKQIPCKRKPYISPERWLWYIDHAEYVVTDAFHGTVFSLIFNTDFYSQISSYGKDTGSRITNLLEVYQLEGRLINDGINLSEKHIDFEQVNRIMQKDVAQSIDYLKKGLSLESL